MRGIFDSNPPRPSLARRQVDQCALDHQPFSHELYGDWHHVERAALADGAKKRTEVLWVNDSAWNTQQGKLL